MCVSLYARVLLGRRGRGPPWAAGEVFPYPVCQERMERITETAFHFPNKLVQCECVGGRVVKVCVCVCVRMCGW